MTLRPPGLLAAAAAVALLWGARLLLRDSDETRIREACGALAAAVEKTGADEGALRTLSKRDDFVRLLDATVRLDVRETGWSGTRPRAEVADRFFAARQSARTLRVRFDDLAVTVDPGGASAGISCDASVAADSPWGSGEDVREVRARLVKKDGRWLFSSATVVPIVRK